jgi:uncharacterized protein (DUF1501 family)
MLAARLAAGQDAREPACKRTLVLLQLTGGVDALSVLVPHGDDAYARAREATRIEAGEVLRLDERVGLHARLPGLYALHGQGRLALIEGVGYPVPSRSHFKSLDVWHTADLGGRHAGEGWIGRLCGLSLGSRRERDGVVHIGPRPPYSLHSSTHPPISFTAPESYDWFGDDADLTRLAGEGTGGTADSLAFLRGMLRDARASSVAVRGATERHRPRVTYPGSALARDLRAAAALIHAELGVRVVSVELGGFDTHSDQRATLERLLSELDGALKAFLGDLDSSAAGRATLVLCFSEFGRRLAENGSRGTDHGAAGLMLALGHEVRGGLYGAPPSLTELDDGDPVHTTDFRSAYATAIEHCFGLAHERVLGLSYPLLAFV